MDGWLGFGRMSTALGCGYFNLLGDDFLGLEIAFLVENGRED